MLGWIRSFASLKVNVLLLTLLALAMAGATIVEARYGTQTARAVYYAPWFLGLQALLALNLLCSLAERWPWGPQRIGFVLTHTSIVIILIGAWITLQGKTEGQLALWEGEESAAIQSASQPGQVEEFALPFAIRLDAFEIDYYPGTRRPAMFRSRVTVRDDAQGLSFPAVIEMNKVLKHGGYRFFQSSYQQRDGREMSILSVSRDHGEAVVFLGYVLLLLGMLTVFLTRLSQRRKTEQSPRPEGKRNEGAASLPLATALILGTLGALTAIPTMAASETPALQESGLVQELASLPVQHDGRIMPLDTLAREATWRVTGERRWQDVEPVALFLGMTFQAEDWAAQPLVRIGDPDLVALVGLNTTEEFFSFQQLAGNTGLTKLIREARGRSEMDQPLSRHQEAAREVEDRLRWLQGVFSRRSLKPSPAESGITDPWTLPANVASAPDLLQLRTELRSAGRPGYPSSEAMAREIRYNRINPSRLAWVVLLAASLISLYSWLRPRRWTDLTARLGLLLGFLIMTWGLATRWQIAGRIPASNMYESLLFLGWGVGLFALVGAFSLSNRLVVLNASLVATIVMMLVDLLPLDPFVHPMPPVLSGTPWLAIHVPITMLSYSMFALGCLVAHIQVGFQALAPRRQRSIRRLADLLYWYLHVGSILLTAGIITGSIWAASSWGRYWGWDPKEVWSLIALLAYMAILHGRFDRWIGAFGVAALSILAFWTILMTYLGVNFILASGLHSYGFGESSLTRWLAVLATAEIVFLLASTVVVSRRQSA